jgi:multidrug resistance efflux pump
MKTMLMTAVVVALAVPTGAQQGMSDRLRQGITEEETTQNLQKAIEAYRAVVAQYDQERKVAGTALFRLAECYRKTGRRDQAIAAYQRVVREFPDQAAMVDSSRRQLEALGAAEAWVRSGGQAGQQQSLEAARARLQEARKHLEDVQSKYQAKHPEVVKAQSDVRAAEHQLQAAQVQLRAGSGAGSDRETPPQVVATPRPEVAPAIAQAGPGDPEATKFEMQLLQIKLSRAEALVKKGLVSRDELATLEVQYAALQHQYQAQLKEQQSREQQAQEQRVLNQHMIKSVEDEIALVQQQIQGMEAKVDAGTLSPGAPELLQLRRDLLGLQRKLDELRAGLKR